ncbi:MAG TPA: complex I subunit 1 family protein [Chthoniobacteraceae bacterium]|nr:complex I subunit 1 family protein [Chthoniobacteraceae bacterium]
MNLLLELDWFYIATSLAKTVFLLGVVLTLVSYTVYAERRVSALMQDRLGPNRTGFPITLLGAKKDFSPFLGGLGQPIADAVKLLLKEDFTPNYVNKFYYWIAPGLGIAAGIVALAVIPFGSEIAGVPMVIANLDIGPLFVFALTSVGVYGIVLAGWSSNSKYSFLGGMRSTSQMISYELSLGLSVVPLFLILGKLNLVEIIAYQVKNGWMVLPGITAASPSLPTLEQIVLWIPVLISFIIFTVAMFAETNRLPFDLPEAETELVGGYHTEYSSMKFALFFLGEYAAMILGSSLIVVLFFGGWSVPWIPDGSAPGAAGIIWGLVNIGVFFAKVVALLLFFIAIRWTLPRFRYDQLMKLGWIWFFEIALVNIFLTAFILAYFFPRS